MMDAPDSNALTFDGPALYRIRVRGEVPQRWSPRLEGMTIVVEASANPPLTTLTGDLDDQASLAGVLRTLYELHLPVLSVECLNAKRV
jgi:hypothetical protein